MKFLKTILTDGTFLLGAAIVAASLCPAPPWALLAGWRVSQLETISAGD
ncbi:hypothetical protein [Devosia sp. Root436]|jgi:hypothetical protein|nr:hypothetical protein [Devosia sp. Root436]